MKKTLVLIIIVALSFAGLFSTENASSTSAFLASAQKFIESHSKVIPQLKGAELVYPLVYKDKLGKNRVIVYGVKRDKTIIGRIVVNYNVKNPVVLEFSETPPPHLLNIRKELYKKFPIMDGATIRNTDFIYVFPLLYYVHYKVYKNNTGKDLYFFLNEKKLVTLKEIPDFPKISDSVTTSPVHSIKGSFGSYKILSDVPDYSTSVNDLCNNCGPVAGANILGYWHKHGYYYLQHDWDESNGNDLIVCLWNDMDTNCVFGTPASNFRSGIVLHANTIHNGYLGIYHFSAYGNSFPHFSDAVQEISHGRPFGILIRRQGSYSWWHWITCIGYYSGYEEYIYVRDVRQDGTVAINWNAASLNGIPIYIDGFNYVYPSY